MRLAPPHGIPAKAGSSSERGHLCEPSCLQLDDPTGVTAELERQRDPANSHQRPACWENQPGTPIQRDTGRKAPTGVPTDVVDDAGISDIHADDDDGRPCCGSATARTVGPELHTRTAPSTAAWPDVPHHGRSRAPVSMLLMDTTRSHLHGGKTRGRPHPEEGVDGCTTCRADARTTTGVRQQPARCAHGGSHHHTRGYHSTALWRAYTTGGALRATSL